MANAARFINPAAGVRPEYQLGTSGEPNTDVVEVTAAATLILAASPDGGRAYAVLVNEDNANTVRLGATSAVTFAGGIRLRAGDSIAWPSQSAVYGICDTALTADVSYVEFVQPLDS